MKFCMLLDSAILTPKVFVFDPAEVDDRADPGWTYVRKHKNRLCDWIFAAQRHRNSRVEIHFYIF